MRGYTLDEEQQPVPNCLVRSTTGGCQTVSDGHGFYELANVPCGTYDFVCRKTGYVPSRITNQTVAAGKLTLVDGEEARDVRAGEVAFVADPAATLHVQSGNDAAVAIGFGRAELSIRLG